MFLFSSVVLENLLFGGAEQSQWDNAVKLCKMVMSGERLMSYGEVKNYENIYMSNCVKKDFAIIA
jgi:hypothetical protein